MIRQEMPMSQAIEERTAWLEDIFAGLLINGVKIEEILICDQPGADGLTSTVYVRGAAKYQCIIRVKQEPKC